MRANLLERLTSGTPVVDGVMGFDDTVLPQIENAILSGHHMVFLGERGQAKSRIIRALALLLDEAIPVVDNSRSAKVFERMSGQVDESMPEDAPGWIVSRYEQLVSKCAAPAAGN